MVLSCADGLFSGRIDMDAAGFPEAVCWSLAEIATMPGGERGPPCLFRTTSPQVAMRGLRVLETVERERPLASRRQWSIATYHPASEEPTP